MKRNMYEWLSSLRQASVKKALPILSFPGMQLIDATVDELVRSGHLQAQCMEAIAKRYDTAASVTLMDLSVEAEAFGSPVRYSASEVPTVTGAIIKSLEDAENLQVPAVGAGRTGEYVKTIAEAVELITDRPVLAGCIGPFSLAGRLMDMTEIMVLCYEEPEMVKMVLDKATDFIISNILAFKEAGANGVILAEPAAGLLSPKLIAEFSNPYVKRIIEAVEDENFLLVYHNCGNTIPLLSKITEIGARAIHLGNAVNIEDALKFLPNDVVVMGNVDPASVFRNGSPETVKATTQSLLERCSPYSNFVISSGCDIPPVTPMKNIDAFFDAIEEFNG